MKVQELQQFLRGLAQPMRAAGGARVADDLDKAAHGLEPFREKTINDFCGFLAKVGDHFVQHGELPKPGRVARAPKAGSAEKVKDATQRVMALYEKAQDADFSYDLVKPEMQQLNSLTLPELKLVAKELDISKSFRKKQDALDEIERKIKDRRENRDRTQIGGHAPAATPVGATHQG